VEAWPGEVEVLLPPGSVAIFDTTLWHSAKAGTQPGLRRLFGAHYQGWSETRVHGEDNACDSPEVLAETRDNIRFRNLVERKPI
jgi:ectoine hydroxylase-related dioxygenase (phytanoyl-CoA dioxygenase family)